MGAFRATKAIGSDVDLERDFVAQQRRLGMFNDTVCTQPFVLSSRMRAPPRLAASPSQVSRLFLTSLEGLLLHTCILHVTRYESVEPQVRNVLVVPGTSLFALLSRSVSLCASHLFFTSGLMRASTQDNRASASFQLAAHGRSRG